jgi:hypothetical protein
VFYRNRSRDLIPTLLSLALVGVACNDSPPSGGGSDEESGQGDGDGDSGDGDGDGESGDGDGDGESGDGDGDGESGDGDGDSGDGDGDDDTGPKFDTLETADLGEGGACNPGTNNALLHGTVFAPNGTIPVVGALVYVTSTPPEGIPDGVYCAECVELECGVDFTETDVDGSFALPTNSGAGKYLVVQKGQFMRVTEIDIAPGPTDLPDAQVELPDIWDPAAGLYIPKIAVADGSFDRIEDALGKFGLGDTMISNFTETTIPGTESFALYDNGRNPSSDGFVSQGTMTDLISNPNELAQYHIVFVPCSSDTHSDSIAPDSVQNIRDWVAAGGRWYVADWSNEFMAKVFPEYQNFYGGDNADLGSYDSLADVLDDGLLEWLMALPDPLKDINPLNDEGHPTLYQLPQVMTVDNWSGIQYPLPEVLVDDGMGNQVNVGHVPWLEGPGSGGQIPQNPAHPLTVTGQFGCGKIQFTSYHTAEFFDYVGLSPQELVLIYTILEIGVCQEDLPPPEG